VPNGAMSREVAFDVAVAVERDGAYANLALPVALGRSDLDERDRGFVTELVYGSLRAQGELDAVIQEATHRDSSSLEPEVRVLLRLGVYQLLRMRVETHAAVNESVRLAKIAASTGLQALSMLLCELSQLIRRSTGNELLASQLRLCAPIPPGLQRSLRAHWQSAKVRESSRKPSTLTTRHLLSRCVTFRGSPNRGRRLPPTIRRLAPPSKEETPAEFRVSRRSSFASKTRVHSWPHFC
jgi:transcription termination factor NusB